MCRVILFILTISFFACNNSTTVDYYIVRHAEKAIVDSTNKSSDVPLSAEGIKRAESLKSKLKNKEIKFIYSTNTVRTKATVQPLSNSINVPIQIYDGGDTSFVTRLKGLNGNVLIVGHANTVDDVVNGLMGKRLIKDLPEDQFGDLFIVHKRGNQLTYDLRHY